MTETLVTRADRIKADLAETAALLAALPERRQWDIEPERKRLRAKLERLVDELSECDG